MDVAIRFADREDAYHSKRARSLEDDKPHLLYSQRRTRKYDNHNQIPAGFKGKVVKMRSIKTSGTAIGTILVATNSSGLETTTCHPKKLSMDHATCTSPMSMEREF
jgi:hypothetical protein